VKKSKVFRKAVNQMRALAEVPTPARRFKYPPTFAAVGATPSTQIGTCKRPVGSVKVRRGKLGRLRRKQDVEVRCGGRVYLRRGSLGKRRVVCVDCQARKRARLKQLRLERQIHSRFGIDVRAAAEQRKASRFKRFARRAA
jgi:hypothetical protein